MSELFTHTVFQVFITHKMVATECTLQKAKRRKSQVLHWDCREMRKKKFKVQTSADEDTASIFWDS